MKRNAKCPWLLGATCCALLSTAATAANYQGAVANVMPFGGTVYVLVSNGSFGGASSNCPFAGTSMVYSIDPSTPFGRTLVAVALSAKLSGRLVFAAGDGVCGTSSPFGGPGEGLVGMDLKG